MKTTIGTVVAGCCLFVCRGPTPVRAFSIGTPRRSTARPSFALASEKDWSYGESSRPFRRDVFGYDNWVDHRSTDRFIGNLLDILKSGVFRELLPSCAFTSSIALFVVLYNSLLVNGYDDFAGVHHDALFLFFPLLKIPADFFSLCTPSLGLLLGTCSIRMAFLVFQSYLNRLGHTQRSKRILPINDGMKGVRIGERSSIVHDPLCVRVPHGSRNVIKLRMMRSNG
jgi:hypothetical protein